MYLARHPCDLPHASLERGSVVTIGAYDGLHLGHQALLAKVREQAGEKDLAAVVMSFEPTPKEFFGGDSPPARLMRFREKYEALAEFGLDVFFCPRFSPSMRGIEALDFVRQILVHGLRARHVIVGDDFHFARQRSGNTETLKRAGQVLDFEVEAISSVIVDGVRVSSTAIRRALAAGECGRAAELLGRPYSMSGRIVRGRQVGRTLGYPTANVDLRRRQSAVDGIFAVRVHGLGGRPRNGVASVGTRPTFGIEKPVLEVHLFDFSEDIYGAYIRVEFVEFIRGVEKFADAEELISQMHRDADNARQILARQAA
ncbi:MAG: bifunctional riboflavin kinase/FAD synthetase [Pseudomonadota bacterium]